jgi:hypothetical protein
MYVCKKLLLDEEWLLDDELLTNAIDAVQAVEGVDDMILRMSLGEKAMWFTSLDREIPRPEYAHTHTRRSTMPCIPRILTVCVHSTVSGV